MKIRKFKFEEDTFSEGRYFYADTVYDAHYELLNGKINVVFFADNGVFDMPPELFEKLIVSWELKEVAE